MKIEDYADMRGTTPPDVTKPKRLRCAQGLILLQNLCLETDDVWMQENELYATGPKIEDLREDDARALFELGWHQLDCTPHPWFLFEG
jgi:hypothetical protein